MRGNENLVIDPENVFDARAVPAPYFVLPSWWRGFIFKVLTPRQLAVYLYLCTLFDQNGVAYPRAAQIMRDLGLKNRNTLATAIEHLEFLGFIITAKRRLDRERKIKRTVYQRPSIEYTLRQMIEANTIDANLAPTNSPQPLDQGQIKATLLGLRNLTKLPKWIQRYASIKNRHEKRAALLKILDRSLQRRNERAATWFTSTWPAEWGN